MYRRCRFQIMMSIKSVQITEKQIDGTYSLTAIPKNQHFTRKNTPSGFPLLSKRQSSYASIICKTCAGSRDRTKDLKHGISRCAPAAIKITDIIFSATIRIRRSFEKFVYVREMTRLVYQAYVRVVPCLERKHIKFSQDRSFRQRKSTDFQELDEKKFHVLIKHKFMKDRTSQDTNATLEKHYGDKFSKLPYQHNRH